MGVKVHEWEFTGLSLHMLEFEFVLFLINSQLKFDDKQFNAGSRVSRPYLYIWNFRVRPNYSPKSVKTHKSSISS